LQTSAKVGTPTMTQESDTNTETLHPGSGPQLTTGNSVGASQSKSVVAVVEPGSSIGSGASTGDSHNGEHDIANTDQPAEASAPGANGAESGSTPVAPAPGEAVPPAADGTPASTPATDAAASTDAAKTDSAAAPADGSKPAESTSKKKKGLKKLVPW
jgi:hypothetical protein